MQEDFVSIVPKNTLVSQLIDYYYFHNICNEGGTYSVIYYPHYVTAINFYENSNVVWDNNGRIIEQINEKKTVCLFTNNIKTARYVTIKGSIKKIGIVFKPLGVNHFIKGHLSGITKEVITPFDYFGDSFISLSKKLFKTINVEDKRNHLDQFFLDSYIGFKDQAFKKIIFQMIDAPSNLSVKDIASDLNINRKTVLRKFKDNLCTTPSDFKTLLKFRHALHQYNTNTKLTKIAYNNYYYDQSDFIKQYKKLAGLTPKRLFKSISEKGNNRTLWTKIDL